jgi:hypothetical protein
MQYEKPVLSQREIPPEALDWFFYDACRVAGFFKPVLGVVPWVGVYCFGSWEYRFR